MKNVPFLMKYYIQKIFFTFCFFLMAFKRRKNKEKWFFLFRTDHLGDLLASISVLRHFTACYQQKGYRVAIVVDAPLQWVIEKSVPCDKVYPILVQKVQTDLRYRMNVLLDFYRYPIQAMISLVSSPIALCFLEIFLFAKESHRFIGDWSEVPFFFDFYKRRYDYTYRIMYNSSIHDQLEEVFQKITGQKSKYESPDFYQIFDEIGVPPPCTGKYYLVFPGASVAFNCWGREKFAELIAQIRNEFPEYTAVIMGSKADKEYEAQIMKALQGCTGNVLPRCGSTDLKTLFSWCRSASFVVSNDSGGANLAGMYNILTFVLLHGGFFGFFMPNKYYSNHKYICPHLPCYPCQNNCIYAGQTDENQERECLKAISVKDAFDVIKDNLNKI